MSTKVSAKSAGVPKLRRRQEGRLLTPTEMKVVAGGKGKDAKGGHDSKVHTSKVHTSSHGSKVIEPTIS